MAEVTALEASKAERHLAKTCAACGQGTLQGHRVLSCCASKDFLQVGIVPASNHAFGLHAAAIGLFVFQ